MVGLGPHGHRMIDALLKSGAVDVIAGIDRSPKALEGAPLPPSAKRSESLAEVLVAGVDVLCIMTNGPSHAPIALEALQAGVKGFIIAKPMACSVADCQAVIAEAKARGARVGVDHIRRYTPAYRFLRDRVASGEWGVPRAAWVQRPGIGLGCNGTHSFDLAQYLLGSHATRVSGWLDPVRGDNPRGKDFVDPGGLVVIELANGARVTVAQIEDGAGPGSVELDLTAARVRVDEKSGEIEISERDLSVKPAPGKPAVYRRGTVPEGVTARVDMHQGLAALLKEVLGTGEIAADAAHGLASIAVLAAAHVSARRGSAPVAVDDPEVASLFMPVT